MSYSLVKSTISHFNPGLIARTLTEIRLGATTRLFSNYLAQEHSIWRQNKNNETRPTSMQLELTTYCPRRCKGCYIHIEDRQNKEVIDLETAHQAIQKGSSWGIKNYNFMGGEPLNEYTIPIVESIVREHDSLSFYCCTNGSYLYSQNEKLDNIVLRNNFCIGLSIDGFEETNDSMRGKNSYRDVISAADYLSSRKCFFGAVVTLRSDNLKEAKSEEFIDFLIEKGFIYIIYSISSDIDKSSCSSALETVERMKKPIFIYINSVGHINDQSRMKKTRDIYLDKNGNILNSRLQRIHITDSGADLDAIVSDRNWTKRFTRS